MTAELAQLDQADKMLAAIVTAEDARVTADYAAAAAEVAKKARLGLSASNRAKAIEVKALMRLATLVDEGQAEGRLNTRGRPVKVPSGTFTSLADIGTTKQTVDRARTMRDTFSPAEVDALAATDKELTVGGLVSAARKGPVDVQDDWYTPQWLFGQLGLTFDVDVCAPVDPAQRNTPARSYYTEADDGLAQPWTGLVWCNPPYSDPAPWITRWIAHDNGLLLTHFSVGSTRTPPLWAAAHGIRFFCQMWFDRPDGTIAKPYWGLTLAARGAVALAALDKVDDRWVSPLWVPA